eukprot:9479837-Pyramimonas_sp.AAC.1
MSQSDKETLSQEGRGHLESDCLPHVPPLPRLQLHNPIKLMKFNRFRTANTNFSHSSGSGSSMPTFLNNRPNIPKIESLSTLFL